MADDNQTPEPKADSPTEPPPTPAPITHIAPSPHVGDTSRSTQWMMLDVLIALVPLMMVAIWQFGLDAIRVTALCVVACAAVEALFAAARRKPLSLKDGSAIVTGVILAMSLPWSCPWYVAVIGSAAAVALGKMVFGGLGQNMFNPAMVGRAFVMICFATAMSGPAYVDEDRTDLDVVTRASPMTELRITAKAGEDQQAPADEQALAAAPVLPAEPNIADAEDDQAAADASDKTAPTSLWALFIGNTNGSLGETSAIACLIGGLYLLIRRTAAWQIPLGAVLAVAVIAGIAQLAGAQMTIGQHVLGGALMFGAFFIATDPVSSPLTPRGRLIFGIGFGAFVMLLRLASSYPEGVMFAVLLMNAVVPLINRWTIPTPVGGAVPERKPS